MPVTQGAGNPNWSRDETLLALDLLYRHGAPVHKGHSDVAELSALLRSALIHPRDVQRPSFRNEDGVALKIQNLMSALHPSRSLSSSATDRQLVTEFPPARAKEVAEIAATIREAIASGATVVPMADDEVFVEGHLLSSRHRVRERRLRTRLLAKTSDASLVCAICNFTAPEFDRALRESFYEAHHVWPLSGAEGVVKTRVKDMALLCACCHRFIHKLIALDRRWVSIAHARSKFLEIASPSE